MATEFSLGSLLFSFPLLFLCVLSLKQSRLACILGAENRRSFRAACMTDISGTVQNRLDYWMSLAVFCTTAN